MDNTKLAAEVVKLKQEMAELRATIERIDAAVFKDHDGNYSPTLKPIDDGWGHAEDGWPWDVTELGCTCKWHKNLAEAAGSTVGWWCPVHERVAHGSQCWQRVF